MPWIALFSSVISSLQLWLAMQNKGLRYVFLECLGFLIFPTWPPMDHFNSAWTPSSLLLFVYEMTPDQRHAGITLMWAKPRKIPAFHLTTLCCYSADKAVKRGPRLNGPPLFLTPLALSLGADPLYMPCSSAITMTQFPFKTVFPKLQKEPGPVQELLRETVPLSLTVRDA